MEPWLWMPHGNWNDHLSLYYYGRLVVSKPRILLSIKRRKKTLISDRILWKSKLTLLVNQVYRRLALWDSILSYHLQCQHPLWALLWVLAVPLLLQLPINSPGKEVQHGPVLKSVSPMWDTSMELLLPGFDLTQPWPFYLSWEWTNGWKIELSLSVSLSLIPSLPNLTFK